MCDSVLWRPDKQFSYMRNVPENIITIGPYQLCQIDITIKDSQLISFANQAFNNLNNRALSKIVSPRLETQAKNADLFTTAAHHHIASNIDLLLVAQLNSIQDWQFYVGRSGQVGAGAKWPRI